MADADTAGAHDAPEQDIVSAGTDKRMEEDNKKEILAFNVAHVMVSLLFLWLLYEPDSSLDNKTLTMSVPFRRSDFSFSRKASC